MCVKISVSRDNDLCLQLHNDKLQILKVALKNKKEHPQHDSFFKPAVSIIYFFLSGYIYIFLKSLLFYFSGPKNSNKTMTWFVINMHVFNNSTFLFKKKILHLTSLSEYFQSLNKKEYIWKSYALVIYYHFNFCDYVSIFFILLECRHIS